ncbi:MAG: nucleotide exchange factor GrpE [Halobaculum sp.]
MTDHTDETEPRGDDSRSLESDRTTDSDDSDHTAGSTDRTVDSGDHTADGTDSDTDSPDRRLRELERENEALRTELAEAEREIEQLRDRLDEKEAAVTRFKQQQREKLAEQTATATADLVSRLLADVWDPLERAAAEDESLDVREGVRLTLEELDAVLSAEGVTVIRPEPGDRLDRERHSVLRTVESSEPAGTILSVERPGFSMEGEIREKARVCVAGDG